jgi:hypothetical protein
MKTALIVLISSVTVGITASYVLLMLRLFG